MYIHMRICWYMHVRMCTRARMCGHTWIHVYIDVDTYIYIFIYLYNAPPKIEDCLLRIIGRAERKINMRSNYVMKNSQNALITKLPTSKTRRNRYLHESGGRHARLGNKVNPAFSAIFRAEIMASGKSGSLRYLAAERSGGGNRQRGSRVPKILYSSGG